MATVFDPAVRFLADLGVFEVLIPFMLSFTLVYAILQKTQVLGREKDGSSKKNINAMIAFAVSFIFVASLQLVSSAVMIAQYSAVAILGMLLLFTIAKLSGHGKWEAFGISMLEAMAKGCTIVSTKTEGGKFLIEEAKNGFLFDYGNLDSLKTIFSKLLTDKKILTTISKNNLEKAKRFTWNKIAQDLEQKYKGLP